MVGQPAVIIKPSRSDEILDPDQQIRISEQVKAQFDSMLPKRPSKPNRSDPDLSPTESLSNETISTSIPELDKFQSLQSQSRAIFSGTNSTVEDEFVETEYYKKLDSIDKQHYTTGSGFIKVMSDKHEDDGYDLQLQRQTENSEGFKEMVFKSNPATNDWIPSVEYNQVGCVSSKPNRSENC